MPPKALDLRGMVGVVLVVLVFLPWTGCKAQTAPRLSKVAFHTMSRGGGYKKVVVAPGQAAYYSGQYRGGAKTDSLVATLSAQDWAAVEAALVGISLDSLETLKAPSNLRAMDGAWHSSLSIWPSTGDRVVHDFDNEAPHPRLKALLALLLGQRDRLRK